MSKNLLLIALTGAILLSACASATPESNTTAPTAGLDVGDAEPEMVCTSETSDELPQQRATYVASLPYPPVSEDDWQRGPADAEVTIVEYSDLQCPNCAALEPILTRLAEEYPEDVRLVFRHFPLIGTEDQPIHPLAALAAQAAEAAGRQDAFWELHDLLIATQAEWTTLSEDEFTDWLVDTAGDQSLDSSLFAEDLADPELAALAQDAWDWGVENNLPGTPFLLVNGSDRFQWRGGYAELAAVVKLEMLANDQFTGCPEMTIDPDAEYTVTLQTEKGDIVLRLLPDVAPMAVNSFVFLAENDWFDGVSFHRVIPGFMAQGGDPTGTGLAGPGYTFGIEISSDWLFDREGLLAMANSGPTSNGSQFFITYGAASHLNGAYTIFGEVLEGMDVLESLSPRDPAENPDAPAGDLILDVIVEVN